MGDTLWVRIESEPFQFTFNGFLKVAFQGSRVTSDAGLILVRELDERLGLEAIMAEHLSDSRHGLNTQFRLPDLLRQSIYSRLAGYEDLNDAQRLSTDPTFRLIGSPTRWDRSAALTSTLHWFETELLTREENLVGLIRAPDPEPSSSSIPGQCLFLVELDVSRADHTLRPHLADVTNDPRYRTDRSCRARRGLPP